MDMDSDLDVLRCPTVQVDGGTYRVQSAGAHFSYQPPSRAAERAQLMREEEDDEEDDDPSIVEEPRGGGFKAAVSADEELFGFVIGKGGKNKREIEQDTGATLHFPPRAGQGRGGQGSRGAPPPTSGKSGQSNTEVVVRGPSRAAVRAARTRVELCVDSALNTAGWQTLPYTHFVSIPLASAHAEAVLTRLKATALAADGGNTAAAAGIEEAMFWEPKQLHLTLAMLKLYSAQARETARKTLTTLRELQPLTVRLRGLEYMNDDPSEVKVLFLKVQAADGSDALQQLCDGVVSAFAASGLLLPQDERPVKLHATIINSRLSGGSVGSGGARRSFDARALLREHGEELDVGEHRLTAVHLSQRGVFDADGYYHCVAKRPLP